MLLVWDVTCTDTFAPSFLASAASEAGAVAALAEKRKKAKYIPTFGRSPHVRSLCS